MRIRDVPDDLTFAENIDCFLFWKWNGIVPLH